MANIRADIWIYPLKHCGFSKADCKKIRLELLRLGSANQELPIFSQLANEPVFTPNISKPHVAHQPVPGAGPQGDGAGRVAGAGSAEHRRLQHLPAIPWPEGEKSRVPRPTRGAKACRAAKDPQITLPHARQGLLPELSVLSNQSPLTGWQRGTKPTGMILKVSRYKRPGAEEPSALTTTTACQVISK